jgi:hypothetical protein
MPLVDAMQRDLGLATGEPFAALLVNSHQFLELGTDTRASLPASRCRRVSAARIEPLLLSGGLKPLKWDLRRRYLERRDGSAGRTAGQADLWVGWLQARVEWTAADGYERHREATLANRPSPTGARSSTD